MYLTVNLFFACYFFKIFTYKILLGDMYMYKVQLDCKFDLVNT